MPCRLRWLQAGESKAAVYLSTEKIREKENENEPRFRIVGSQRPWLQCGTKENTAVFEAQPLAVPAPNICQPRSAWSNFLSQNFNFHRTHELHKGIRPRVCNSGTLLTSWPFFLCFTDPRYALAMCKTRYQGMFFIPASITFPRGSHNWSEHHYTLFIRVQPVSTRLLTYYFQASMDTRANRTWQCRDRGVAQQDIFSGYETVADSQNTPISSSWMNSV